MANERKKLQKAALGLQDSDDEDAAVDVSIVVLKPYSYKVKQLFVLYWKSYLRLVWVANYWKLFGGCASQYFLCVCTNVSI